jgi:hypothetical protein
MTATTNEDQQDVVDQLVHTANTWLGPMPPGCEHMDPLPERLDGFVFSLFPELEGAGGLPQMRLSPKNHPDVNLVDHHMHDTWPRVDRADNAFVREFLTGVSLILTEAKSRQVNRRDAMGFLGVSVCRFIEIGYELRAEIFDEDDGSVEIGQDAAPGLAAAFRTAWEQ